MTVLYDDDIRDYLTDMIDYSIEDEGIGYYEYGDGKYVDKNLQMRLTTDEIMVQYSCDYEQLIPTQISGTKNGYDNNDYDYEIDWIAELSSVTWNKESKLLEAVYSISEN